MSDEFRKFVEENIDNIVRVHDSVDVNEEVKSLIENDTITEVLIGGRTYLLGKNNLGVITQRIRLSDKFGKADDFYQTVGPTTIRGDWWPGFYLDMGNVSKEGDIVFENGKKPVRLLEQLIDFTTNDNDIILDFFAGSSTTAHAVINLNQRNNLHRKFIMIQLPENLDETILSASGDAKKSIKKAIQFLDSIKKPHLLSEIGKERIHRVISKVYGDANNSNNGFKVFKVSNTNIRWDYEDIKAQRRNMMQQETQLQIAATKCKDLEQIDIATSMMSDKDQLDFMPGTKDIDVVYELLLRQRDIPLSAKIELLSEIGERTYLFAQSYLVCLETEITNELIEKIAAINPLPIKFIFRDSAFEDDINLKDETIRRFRALVARNTGEQQKAYTVEFI